MVRFKQKVYSKRSFQLLRRAKGIQDKVNSRYVNLGLKLREKMGATSELTPPSYRYPRKTNTQLNRDTIETANKVRDTKDKLNRAAITPIGVGVDKGITLTLENPISTVGQIAGKAALLHPNPVIKSLPYSAGALAAEKALKTKVPGYDKSTKKLSKFWTNRKKFREKLRENTPTPLDISNMIVI